MSNRFKPSFLTLAIIAFTASLATGALVMNSLQATPEPLSTEGAHASWVSEAESVSQLAQEADLIVRVQVIQNGEPRYLWSPTPAGAERKDGRSTFVFTDTEVEVLEVYGGSARVGDRLWALQTGGDLVTRSGEISRLELREDPIYAPGEEMVLFLVDISGDRVHAKGRNLYRAVNPNGRFQLEGTLASRSLLGESSKARQELTLGALEDAIGSAIAERQVIDPAF